MNDKFLNIKVDREEHPDIDSLYMAAVQGMTGQGGVAPYGLPESGGAPLLRREPTSRHRDGFGLPSFPTVLNEVARMYRENSGHVEEVTAKIKGFLSGPQPSVTSQRQPHRIE